MSTTTIYKRFDLPTVTTANSTVKDQFELDKFTRRVKGILITADQDDQLYYRGTARVELDGCEVFPEDFHVKLLMSGLGVPPIDRYHPLDLDPGNMSLKVAYKDSDNPLAVFQGYTPSVYVKIEIDENGLG